MPSDIFKLFFIVLILASSCKKMSEKDSKLLVANQTEYDIGSEATVDRELQCIYKGTSQKVTYYAEFIDTLSSPYKGWVMNLYNKETRDIISTLRVYHARSVSYGKIIFEPGIYYTNSLLIGQDTLEAVAHLTMYKDGSTSEYKAIRKVPTNYIKIEKPSADQTILTINAEMNSNSGQPSIQVTGRFKIKEK